MVTGENPTVQRIAQEVQQKYGFLPLLALLPIIIDAIRLLWDCVRPKSPKEGQAYLANNYTDGKYNKMAIIFTQRNLIRSAKKQGVILTLEQAKDIAIMILDGLRTGEEEQLPDFNLI